MKLTIIGRDPKQASYILNSAYSSSYHAELIQLENGDLYLVDKSTNGTKVNGVGITPGKEILIRRGDYVQFADEVLDWSRIPIYEKPLDVKRLIKIGSHFSNDIVLQSQTASRFHATIREKKNGKWEICDHSLNGTSINGKRLPKDRYVPIKAGDKITCVGIPVDNPVKGSKGKTIGIISGLAIAVALFAILIISKYPKATLTPEQIIDRYSTSVALLSCSYHFTVSCGTLDINQLPDPDTYNKKKGYATHTMYDEFVIEGDYIKKYDGTNSTMYTGTGFFIGETGHLVTNRHIACPWETAMTSYSSGSITIIEAAEDYYKQKLTRLYEMGYTPALQYISQVKVSGKLDAVNIFPNRSFVDFSNMMRCKVVAVPNDKNVDLSIMQIMNATIPANVKSVPLSAIIDKEYKPGAKIVTIGFPFGVLLQESSNSLEALFSDGSISKSNDKYNINFTATSYHGASGSPIFDEKGDLAGIVKGGIDTVQGFNVGVKTSHLVNLIEANNIR